MPKLGDRGGYYPEGAQREPEGPANSLLPIAILALAIVVAVSFLGAWQGQRQSAFWGDEGGIAAFSPTPATRAVYNPNAVLSPRNATVARPRIFKNQSFAPETIVVGNTTVRLTRTIGFAGGRRIETLVFNNTGAKPASFRAIVMFPKAIAQNASGVEIEGAQPSEVYVLQEDPSWIVDIGELAAGAARAVSFSSPVQTITGMLGGGGDEEEFSAGSIHFVVDDSRFPIDSEQRGRIEALLNSPWLQAQGGGDAQKLSEQLSQIFSEAGSLDEALAKAEELFSATGGGLDLGKQTATGEKIEPPKARKCSEGPIIISEFLPGFYCEERLAGPIAGGENFLYSVAGLDDFKPEISVDYRGNTVMVFADYRNRIKGGKMQFAHNPGTGSIQYGDKSNPAMGTFSFNISIGYENNFNNYVRIWPPEMHFKEYGGKAVQKAVLVHNNLPYDLEGFDFTVCGRKMDVKAGEVGAFAANIGDAGCQITQAGENVSYNFAINADHIDFLPKEEAEKFVSEDYLEPRLVSFEPSCQYHFCSCAETANYTAAFAADFGNMLPPDALSYKKLFEKNDYHATRVFLSAAAPENAACPLPGEFQGFGLWPARLNIAKLNADLREEGKKTELENNGYWSGNWAITAGRGGITPASGNEDTDSALRTITDEQFVYYSSDSENKLTNSDENSFYALGQR
ncbi:MAG: hypothetical protein WC792_05405 [Candidatus Micrarchaeia archaeon]|jgi:hypothetical protein